MTARFHIFMSGGPVQGYVLLWDPVKRGGLIGGDDGLRYLFSSDALVSGDGITAGVRVDFIGEAGMARQIFPLGPGTAGASPAYSSGTAAPVGAVTPVQPASSLFEPLPVESTERVGFGNGFKNAMKRSWQARGRASRSELWGFTLMALLIQGLVACGASTIVAIVTPSDSEEHSTYVGMAALVGYLLAAVPMIPAGISVSIRRLHDIGLSGWFYLLNVVPYVGWLFGLIVAFVPSKSEVTRHGPPAGASA